MAVTYEALMQVAQHDVPYAYTERDTLLYAVAVGMGRDPLDTRELDYVYERRCRLCAMPSLAITVARHRLIYDVGLSVERLLHGEQTLTLHRPLPVEADLRADHRIVQVYDKGPGKGSIIEAESRVRLVDGTPLFDIHNLYVARGDGGIGGPPLEQPRPRPMPARAPDRVIEQKTLPHQALLYRLTGDRNVIHADPDIAREMGFQAPILHGSCTLGVACRAILTTLCDYDAARLTRLGTRFSAVVYPGETLATDLWVDGGEVRFRCRALERDAVVLDNGVATVAQR